VIETLLGKTSQDEGEDATGVGLPPARLTGAVSASAAPSLRLAAQTEERRSPLYDLLQESNREITIGQLVDLPAECRHLRDHVLLRIVELPQRRVKLSVPESLTLCLRLTEFPVYYTSGTDVPLIEPAVLRAASVSFGEDALRGPTITVGIG
jgi:hypothetical protein